MCLILFSLNNHPDYPLILAANRDEFLERPARFASYWEEHPSILGGRDLRQGGTWLGIDRSGRLAAVTNYREPSQKKAGARSRGLLVSEYLKGIESADSYMQMVVQKTHAYDVFNLLVGDGNTYAYYCSLEDHYQTLKPGLYGISNGRLDCPWPKVLKGKAALENIIRTGRQLEPESLFEILADRTTAEDQDLPDTGVDIEWERRLSPAFVNFEGYGTRCSTVLLIDRHGEVRFVERTFDEWGTDTETLSYEFMISKDSGNHM